MKPIEYDTITATETFIPLKGRGIPYELLPKQEKNILEFTKTLTLWSQGKKEENETLKIKEKINQLGELLLNDETENVEGDRHIRLLALVNEAQLLFVKMRKEWKQQKTDELNSIIQLAKKEITDHVDTIKKIIYGYQSKLQESDYPNNKDKQFIEIINRLVLLLEKYNLMKPTEFNAFYKELEEELLSLNQSTFVNHLTNQINESIKSADNLWRLAIYGKKFKSFLCTIDSTASMLSVQGIKKQNHLEKEYLKMHQTIYNHFPKIADAFQTKEINLDQNYSNTDLNRVIQTIVSWIKTAKNHQKLSFKHNFGPSYKHDDGEEDLRYADQINIKIISKTTSEDKKFDMVITENLGNRYLISDGEFKLQKILTEIKTSLPTTNQNEHVDVTLPRQQENDFKTAWQKYGHIDAEYKIIKGTFKNLSSEAIIKHLVVIIELFKKY